MIGRFIHISNKSTKTSIQIQLYPTAKKKRQEMHILKCGVQEEVRNGMAAI